MTDVVAATLALPSHRAVVCAATARARVAAAASIAAKSAGARCLFQVAATARDITLDKTSPIEKSQAKVLASRKPADRRALHALNRHPSMNLAEVRFDASATRYRPLATAKGHAAAVCSKDFSTFRTSLRRLNPATISSTPMMISQTPATRINTEIESNG